MRYEWLVKSLQASLLAALGAGCETEEPIRAVADDAGPDMRAGGRTDGGLTPDGGPTPDRGPGRDAGPLADLGQPDGRPPQDQGPPPGDALPPDGAPPPGPCGEAEPVLDAAGGPSGWVRCEDGSLNRVAPSACPGPPPGAACPEGGGGQCAVDSDCQARPHGRCVQVFLGGKQAADCGCAYGCEADADCGADQICLCDAAEGSRCVTATCATNAACGDGECGLSASDDGCGVTYALACRTADDTCRSNVDCGPDSFEACAADYQTGVWQCASQGACGRPLWVAGAPRLAPPAGRSDWAAALCPQAVSPADGEALVAFWTHIAALEHASVASFAKASLQLMALGAPPDLLADAQQAAADEVVHAQLAYGLASAYAQAPVGPGPLALGDLSVETDPAAVARALVAEACIGETLGAAEAAAAAADSADPVVAAVWRRIAADELAHAQLGWRTLKWLLAAHPEARPAAAAAFDGVSAAYVARARAARPGAGLPGVPSRAERAAVHLATLAEVIPAARAVACAAA